MEAKFSPEVKPGPALSLEDPFREILAEAAVRAHRYLQSIGERRVGVTQEALDRLPALGGTLPARGQDPKLVLQLLDEIGSPATIASTGGRLFGVSSGARCRQPLPLIGWRARGIKMRVCLISHLSGRTWRTWCSAGC